MKEAGKMYAQLVAVKGQREHDLGSPHLHVFMAAYVPPQGGDQPVFCRVAGVKTLLDQVLKRQTQAEVGKWVTTCRAEDCDDRPQHEIQRRILFAERSSRTLCTGLPSKCPRS